MARITVRAVRKGDGLALAQMHLENAAYYVELASDDFQMPIEDGLAEFLDPGPDANTATTLAIVAEIEGEVAGYLEAQLLSPMDTAHYQTPSDLAQLRLFINSVATFQQFWRRGVATRLVEAAEEWGRERGASIAVCDTYIGSPVSLPFWENGMGYTRRSVRLHKRLN